MKLSEFKQEWQQVTKMKLFEIAVIDKRRNEPDYITFDIEIQGRSFIAQHEALTGQQERSKKIAYVKQVIDPDFSLDENLQELYSGCIQAIIDSEYFELSEG